MTAEAPNDVGQDFSPAHKYARKAAVLLAVLETAVLNLGAARAVPLIDAVKKGDAAAVSTLIARRVDVNVRELDGATALHWAVHRDDMKTVNLLLAAGADVKAATSYGVTPLGLAAENGSA